MKRHLPFLVLLLSLILLPGCDREEYEHLATTPQGATAPVEDAVKAKAEVDAATLSGLRANIDSARKNNGLQAPSRPREVVDKELGLAQDRLKGVKAAPVDTKAAEARAEAVYQGKAEEAQRLYAEASKQASEETAKRAAAEERLVNALERQQEERKTFLAEAQRLRDQVKKLQSAEQSKQVLTLRLIGIGFLAVFGLAVGFGQLAGLKLGWVFGVIGLLFLGCAQVVAEPWFKWACATVVGLTALGCAWWVWKRNQENTLREDLQKKADALKKVVPILDTAYENLGVEQKEILKWLDEHIFTKLSTAMNGTDKAAVHATRAEEAQK